MYKHDLKYKPITLFVIKSLYIRNPSLIQRLEESQIPYPSGALMSQSSPGNGWGPWEFGPVY